MTGRIGSMSIDGTPISQADVARMEADEALHAEWERKAVRVVAGSALDADDCRLLLSVLGLDRNVIADARGVEDAAGAASAGAAEAATAVEPAREALTTNGKAARKRRATAA